LWKFAALAGLGLAAMTSTHGALGADLSPYGSIAAAPAQPAFLDWEVRGGLYAHDPLSPEAGSVDLNGEVLAPKLWQSSDPFWSFLIPHPDVGATINLGGKTSNLWGGAAWNYDLTDRIFLSPTVGVGVNNGKTGNVVPPGWNSVGCNWWFHESLSVGYRLSANWSVMATVEHSSNAGLCSQNRGLTNAGLRLGYRF
jgi:lipid A 3-O-deacylase